MHFPLELLDEILKQFDVFITARNQEPEFPTDHPPRALHPDIISIRSVCRQFRVLVYEMPFWYTEDVHITALLPGFKNFWWSTHNDYSEWQSEVRALEEHLRDQLFIHALGRRKTWRFKHVPFMATIIAHVPSFTVNATSVILDFPKAHHKSSFSKDCTSAAVSILVICQNLTSIEIVHLRDVLRLNLLSTFCPGLKRLRISEFGSKNPSTLQNNLDGMPCLEEVEVLDFYTQHPLGHSFLPLSSASTLTRLTLICPWEFYPETMCLDVIDNFVNLRSLSLSPLSPKMADWIRRSKIDLSDFRFLLWNRGFNGHTVGRGLDERVEYVMSQSDEILASNSLRNLKEFRFGFTSGLDDYGFSECVHSIVRAVIKHQPHIQKLGLTAAPDDPLPLLPVLENLKYVKWYIAARHEPFSTADIKERLHQAFQLSSADPIIEVLSYPRIYYFAPIID